MKYVRMGTTGTQVSRLCFGAMSFGGMADWMLPKEESFPFIKKALEAGINFFDTADIYSRGESETILGEALKEYGARRDETVIATKVYAPMGAGPNRGGLSRKHIMHSIDESLTRLGMDYVDLYQIHRFDYHTPIEETIEALDDVVKAGKALYIGASSMMAYQFGKYLATADAMGRSRFVTMQNQHSLLYREEEREMNPLCVEEGVGLIPWSPLAGGVLAGSREAGTTRSKSAFGGAARPEGANRTPDDDVIDAVKKVAEARGEKPAQVAISWLLSKPGITAPIIGATKLEQLDDPIKAVDASPLSAEEIAMMEAPYRAKPVSAIPGPDGPAPGAPQKRA